MITNNHIKNEQSDSIMLFIKFEPMKQNWFQNIARKLLQIGATQNVYSCNLCLCVIVCSLPTLYTYNCTFQYHS